MTTAPAAGPVDKAAAAPQRVGMTIRRMERFASVGSTNDIVRGWLTAGEPEICVAIADEQTAGRGRSGRSWTAPPGAALLLSLGFRPSWLAPERVWQLAAAVSLAMAEAAETVAGLPNGRIRLKWPNDLVAEVDDQVRKLAGLLGETDGLGSPDPRAVVGIGVNVDWAAERFPVELRSTMTSLREIAGPIDRELVFERFADLVAVGIGDLRGGSFDEADWAARQITTGRQVELHLPNGRREQVAALGVDPSSGALRIADPSSPEGERAVVVGEVVHVRLDGSA